MNNKKKEWLPQFNSRICPVCNKEFIPAVEHVYKDYRFYHKKPVCSWSCCIKSKRLKEAQPKRKKKGVKTDER